MPWSLLGILLAVCAVACAVGFYKFVYFLSIGYGFAVAFGGVAVFVMYLVNPTATPLWVVLVQTALFIAYGVRLSGFLLVREFKNATFKKTDVAKDTLVKNGEKKMPVFVLATIWLCVSVLYVAQVSPMLFRYVNASTDIVLPIVGFAISAPSMATAMQKCRGRLFPFGWFHVLRALRRNDTLDMMLIAVKPELQGSGINAIVMNHIVQGAIRMGIRYAESGPTLETNDKVQAQWKFFEHEQHKRRRCYLKDLT
jgi:GNAT superfamily N-acetyltransferase